MSKRSLAVSSLVALFAVAGCDVHACPTVGTNQFSVTVRTEDGPIPEDLSIRLYGDGTLIAAVDVQEISVGSPCHAYLASDAGPSGSATIEMVVCSWSTRGETSPPWSGAFVATAKGYRDVNVSLTAEEDDTGCRPVGGVAQVVLEPE